MKALTSCLLFIAALAGCRTTIDLQDGRVPAQYLSQVQDWVGQYAGDFDGSRVVVDLSLQDDRPVLTVSRDLLGADCGSRLGHIASVSVRNPKTDSLVRQLDFQIDYGKCRIDGHTVTVRGKLQRNGSVPGLQISYLRRERPDYFLCFPDPPRGRLCRHNDFPEYVESGRLKRIP
jgi:hypothetical protein